MIAALYGKKIAQSRVYTEDGAWIPVTTVKIEPHMIVRLTTEAPVACTIAIGTSKHVSQPVQGTLKKAGITETKPRFFREEAVVSETELSVGTAITAEQVFTAGDTVAVTGTSKGRGFAGGMKRHGFHGGPKTHGQSDRARAPGSIGAGTTPGRVYKGLPMAGRMGNATTTVKGLRVIAVNNETQTVTISGLIPGGKQGIVRIAKV